MNIYDFAAQMEDDAEKLYRELASKATTTGVKQIFTMLAEDEERHEKAVEVLRRKSGGHDLNEDFLPQITTVFEDMRKNIDNIELSKDQLKDYKIALDIEKKGYEFYKEQFGKTDDEEAKHLFKCMANQELYHIKTIENLIEMLDRPNWWVENAEFTPKMSDYI